MGFGNFAVRMGGVAEGMQDMAGKMSRLRAQDIQNEQQAVNTRLMQQEERNAEELRKANLEHLQRLQQRNDEGFSQVGAAQGGPQMPPAPAVPATTGGYAPATAAPAAVDMPKPAAQQPAAPTGRVPTQDDVMAWHRKWLDSKGDWYLPTPDANRGEMARLDAQRQKVYEAMLRNKTLPPEDFVPDPQAEKLQAMKGRHAQTVQGTIPNAKLESYKTILSTMPNVSPVVTPELLARLAKVENNTGNPMAVSPKGAFGPLQVMPGTFNDMSRMYFGGKLDPRNPSHAEMAGVAYLNHLATVELPRRGIQPTAENVVSAYQQGAGGLAKNGVSAGVTDGITNNAAYVQKVLGQQTTQAPGSNMPLVSGGAQTAPMPQVSGGPQMAPMPQVQGESPVFMANGQDPEAAQRAAEFQHYSRIAQTTGGQTQMMAMQKLSELKQQEYGARVVSVATAASGGDQNAMNQLAAIYGRYTGAPVGVQLRNGQAVVHNQQGQVLASGAPSEVANRMLTSVHSALRQQQIAAQQAYQTKLGENRAYWVGRGQFEKEADYARTGLEQQAKMTIEQAKILADRGEVQLARTADGTGVVAMTKDGSRTWVVDTGANIGGKITPPRMIPVAQADPNMLPGSMLYQKK